jgi:hypothetical protein
MKARRRASQSCHARLDVVRHVPRNLYPVARGGRDTNAPNYRALGAREEVLRLRGFSAGADDFVVKPFSMRELIARVRALLRRSRFTIADHPLTRGGPSTRPSDPKGAPGLARRPSQGNGIPAGDLDQFLWLRVLECSSGRRSSLPECCDRRLTHLSGQAIALTPSEEPCARWNFESSRSPAIFRATARSHPAEQHAQIVRRHFGDSWSRESN